MAQPSSDPVVDPLWYKDAIIYELHVKTFHDSNGDGIGDFRGVIEKLDYLQELGVTALWLLPFYPSPLRDDGYDIADYYDVNPHYGTLADFQAFLAAAHERGLKVITELVINHTSDQNPWFQKSRRAAPGSPERDLYVWSDTPEKYKEARIIFKDFETSNWAWDPVAKAYYWHRFYSHQPDLNFDNPAVHGLVEKVLDFWLNMGVDGLRLDAVPYLYEREGTSCENLRETHEYLVKLRAHVDAHFQGRMLLAEANQWPEDAVAYFGKGDASHMNFHFPLMPRMFMSLQMEDRFPIIDILDQTPADSRELPVGDVPAQSRRVDSRNGDRRGARLHVSRLRERSARPHQSGHSPPPRAPAREQPPQNRAAQYSSLLHAWDAGPLLRRRNRDGRQFLPRGPQRCANTDAVEPGAQRRFFQGEPAAALSADHDRPGVSLRGDQRGKPAEESVFAALVDASRHCDAEEFQGVLPWFARVPISREPQGPRLSAPARRGDDSCRRKSFAFFPGRGDRSLTFCGLQPHGGLQPKLLSADQGISLSDHARSARALLVCPSRSARRRARFAGTRCAHAERRAEFADAAGRRVSARVSNAMSCRNSFAIAAGSARKRARFAQLRIAEQVPISGEGSAHFWFLEVTYTDGAPETYALPVQIAIGESAHAIAQAAPQAVIARFAGAEEAILHDAIWDAAFREQLFRVITQRQNLKGKSGDLLGVPGSALAADDKVPPSQVVAAEQSNSSMLFENKYFLKLYRKLEDGVNPDVEITRFLTERRGFAHVPAFAGAIEYRRGKFEPTVVCLLQAAVANEGDAWALTLDSVGRYYERVLGRKADLQIEHAPPGPLLEELIGGIYPQKAKLLGTAHGRTAPRARFRSGRSRVRAGTVQCALAAVRLSKHAGIAAARVCVAAKKIARPSRSVPGGSEGSSGRGAKILAQEQRILDHSSAATKIRIHGDYHLGQALYTGKDFVILDFEGEPARPLSERKLKRSALRDVAGMMRSFQYAAYSALWQPAMRPEDIPFLERWADLWYRQMGSVFLQSYLEATRGASFVPQREADLRVLLEAYLLDKAVYEVGYELNNRPDWVVIPIRGIKHILAAI